MLNVVYVTPHFTPNTIRFIEAFTTLHNTRLSVISQDPLELLPPWQQSRIWFFQRTEDVCNTARLISIARHFEEKRGKIDRLLGATEQLQEPLAEVRLALGIEGMDVETAHNFRDKSRMKLLFESQGIPCARHKLLRNMDDARSFQECPFPFVIKPVAGAGAQTTFKVHNHAELMNALQAFGQHSKESLILEEFIQGQEYSLDTFSLNGKVLFQTINQYQPTPLEVMQNPWIQWRVLLRKESAGKEFDDIRSEGRKALKIMGMKTGLSHMEWFRRQDGTIAISEVAARPPGAQFTTIISRACDIDVINAWVRLMVFNEPVKAELKYTAGAAYLRGQGNGCVATIEGIQEIRSRYNDIITDIRIPKTGTPKSLNYEGEGYIIVRHPDTKKVEDALADIVATVKVHLQ